MDGISLRPQEHDGRDEPSFVGGGALPLPPERRYGGGRHGAVVAT